MRYALCFLALFAACSDPEDSGPQPTPLESVVYDLDRVLGPPADKTRPGPEELVDRIRERIDPAYWDSSPDSSVMISGEPYRLTVIATPDVHKEIAAYLEEFRSGGK
jgi:hypothetical protein